MHEEKQEVFFRIHRFKPGVIDPPRFHVFPLTIDPPMTVLDCLEQIRLHQDPSLMFRHSCHHASCGTCACIINGREALACTANVLELGADQITVEPLKGYRVIGDIVVDTMALYEFIQDDWSCLRNTDKPVGLPDSTENSPYMRFENCIECASCVSACPPSQEVAEFMGPATLAAIHGEIEKDPQKADALLTLAGGKKGERHCRRVLACSRVCPSKVYPARRISNLRKRLAAQHGFKTPSNRSE